MNMFKLKPAQAQAKTTQPLSLSQQLSTLEAQQSHISAIANAIVQDSSPAKRLAMGQYEAVGRRVERLRHQMAVQAAKEACRNLLQSLPLDVSRSITAQDEAKALQSGAAARLVQQRARLAALTEKISTLKSTDSPAEAEARIALQAAAVAGDDAALAAANAKLNSVRDAVRLQAHKVEDELVSLQLQHDALRTAVAETERQVHDALTAFNAANAVQRNAELELLAVQVDMGTLTAIETLYTYLHAGGRLSNATRDLYLKPGVSAALRSECSDHLKKCEMEFSRIVSYGYFAMPHDYENRLDEDPMLLSQTINGPAPSPSPAANATA